MRYVKSLRFFWHPWHPWGRLSSGDVWFELEKSSKSQCVWDTSKIEETRMYASLVAKPRSKNVIWRILMATWSDRRVSLKWCMNWAEFIFRSKKYWFIYITIFCRNLIFEVNENRKAQAWSINDYNNLFWLFLWNRMHFVTAFNLLYFLNCDSYLGSCKV